MYTAFFGLRESPFSITPDPRYLFLGEHHREARAHLLYGAREGGGFVQLTGEVGTGKTTLCRSLIGELPPDVDVALVLNPKLTATELLATVCDELRAPYPAGTTSAKVLVDALYEHLLAAHARGRRTVLAIDEAQNLGVDVLEQIRLLTNLETAREKLLQIILIGQPELAELLERPKLRQLAQRITARYHLLPLSKAETAAYVRHRIDVAGRTDLARNEPIFSDGALAEVHRLSGGVPRLINVICDRALLGAYAADRGHVDAATIRRASTEVRGRTRESGWGRPATWIATGTAVVAVALVIGVVVAPGPAYRLLGGAAPRLASALSGSLVGERPTPPVSVPLPASPVPARVAAPRVAALAELLRDPALESGQDAALAALLGRWGIDPGPVGTDACERARRGGLQCLARIGTWTKLRRFDLPAVIELVTPSGARRHVVVAVLEKERATLEIGGRAYTFALGEIDPFWDGPFVLLWKPPALSTAVLQLGMRGKDVEWLRHRLSELEGQPVEPRARNVYDDELRERVLAFQRARSLIPDGIAGEETLVHLSLVGAGPAVPRLTVSGPGT